MDLKQQKKAGREEAAGWLMTARRSAGTERAQIQSDLAVIRGICNRLRSNASGPCPARDWLLDNHYLASQAGLRACYALRRQGKLPALERNGIRLRLHRVGLLLADLEELDEECITAFLSGIQEVEPLEEEELALIPAALTAGLLCRLRSASESLEQLLNSGEDPAALEPELRRLMRRFAKLRSLRLDRSLERLSMVDRLFREDPAHIYPQMDPESRCLYRRRLCKLAKKRHLSQTACAQKVVDLARQGLEYGSHIGAYLFEAPLGRPERGPHCGWYVSLLTLLTTGISIVIGFGVGRWWAIFLFLLPVSQLVKNGVDAILLHVVRPRPVFRLELKQGVPPEGKTLCVIAALLTDEESVTDLAKKLERYAIANRRAGEAVGYGILADLPDRKESMTAADDLIIHRAKAAIALLNCQGIGRFYLFFRKPTYVPAEKTYRGRERKRGAILDLVRFLRGRRGEMELLEGERESLRDTKLLLVLDSDTILTMDAVNELVGTMLHPMNQPQVDKRRKIVTKGYGILQPRVETELSSSSASTFARLFSGLGGLDPYGGAVSDLYHDLFDEATFLGKGMFHIDAFLTCMDGRFPENRILSHDLLEGSYLRTGWVSRTELMDSFPSSAISWLDRAHRWIRGDWQLTDRLLPNVKTEAGERERNPISPLARWKMFDNLRRSLVQPATLLALIVGLLGRGPLFAAALLAALLNVASQLLLAAAELLWRRGQGSFRRYHSGVYSGLSGNLLRAGAEMLFLPVESNMALSAVFRTLWRLTVSHRHLLDWVTSSQSGQNKRKLTTFLRRFAPAILLGFALMACSPYWTGRLLGLAWAVTPLLFYRWSCPNEILNTMPQRDRAFLLHECALIWRYYEDWLRPEYHYLIPDNVQAMPDRGAAARTSPTNMGLALLSPLAAADLGLISQRQAAEKVEMQLRTLERLDRWHGHFYNWYDITTLALLKPRYVSTVDSGNLCANLIALASGLGEWGETALASRARKLADEMDFSILFDLDQQLFYIGYDVEAGQYTPSHYDLMASEARTTSYLAVARGEVPPRHWRQLSRAIVKSDRYTGMASWSGTMFEYLMPQLLLPAYPDSLLGETLSYCVDQQRREGARRRTPWGVSESAYYVLDPRQNYQYKAHGIPALSLRRESRRDRVVAPYASILALAVDPESAISNLRRLREMGAEGKYGFYEALDFTPSRGGTTRQPLIVRSWMAHHLGMSLLALDNCLCENAMIRRFLSDPAMSACQELLQEKLPVGVPVTRPEPEICPPREREKKTPRWQRSGTGVDPADPVWGFAANDGYSVLLSAGGAGPSRTGEHTILHPEGMTVQFRRGDAVIPVFPRDAAAEDLSWHYASGEIMLRWHNDEIDVVQTVLVDKQHAGEVRRITVSGRTSVDGTLCVLLRPVLDRWDSYAAHPAFSRMCMETTYVGSGVRFVRRPGRGKDVPVLTVLWSEQEAGWTTNRERYLVTGSISHTGREGTVLDPCLALELPLQMRQGQKKSLTLALAAGSEEDSLLSAQALLATKRPALSNLVDRMALRSGRETITAAAVLLSRLMAPGQLGCEGEVDGQPSLWPFSISGDLPIVTYRVQPEELEEALRLAAVNRSLARLNMSFDLVLLIPEQGSYFQAIRSKLLHSLEERGWEGAVEQPGGIFLISGTERQWQPILGMAAVNLHPGDRLVQADHAQPEVLLQTALIVRGRPFQWHWEENGFTLETRGSLPPLRWSHLLVNAHFGWRCDEAGTGHLWYENAQMGQLTSWQNDPIAMTGPERLYYCWTGGRCSLFAAADGIPAKVTFGPGFARWEKSFAGRHAVLTAFVPQDQPLRVWQISVQGWEEGDRLCWSLAPKLSHRDSNIPWVRCSATAKNVYLENPAGTMPGTVLHLSASQPFLRSDWREGRVETELRSASGITLCAGISGASRPERFYPASDAIRGAAETELWWRQRTAALTVKTPDEALNHYLSFWGPYQVLAGRIEGRNGLYQCAGAYGFRDQLQDVLALLPFAPETAARQIEASARHQFREGDVLHWWHPPEETDARGVRTRISDDLLWLPYALSRWMEEIGDVRLLHEQVPYLEGSPLHKDEEERYDRWSYSDTKDTLYRHGVQAVECVLNRGVGEHGLCLMGTGDWNDGMNRLGAKGRGESVWLTWFLALVLERFAPLCRELGEPDRAERYEKLIRPLADAANRAWDGEWYLRAYDDEGIPVGSHKNSECAIDSVSQSFAVFAPNPRAELARQAAESAYERLYDREHQLVRLLWPPFREEGDPGYIKSYPPGLRENGGQYTHAACWLAMALFRLGEPERGTELLHALLPETHPCETYLAEPYVLAGDVYTAPEQEGRAGWSWYTGAAGWYCQTAMRELLGLKLRRGALRIHPNLPPDWPGYEAEWKSGNWTLHITVQRGEGCQLLLDGIKQEDEIPLDALTGRHELKLTLPSGKSSGVFGKKDV